MKFFISSPRFDTACGAVVVASLLVGLPPASATGAPVVAMADASHRTSAAGTSVPLIEQAGHPPGADASQALPRRPQLMLANVLTNHTVLEAYWVSEKYDGVRGYWDGQQLLTRGGEVVHAPKWFTAGWPATPMDGELWAGRGQFSQAVSTVRQQVPTDDAWRNLKFMVFDLPSHPGPFSARLAAYQGMVAQLGQPWVVAVPQWRVSSHARLQAQLRQAVREGAEGLMLHKADADYRATRNDDLLKVKLHQDAEATVVAHEPGRGKYAGRLGALWVQTPAGVRFKLGTGFSDAQRLDPPAVGSRVTYRFHGLNASGIPRFASFWRVRTD